MTIYNIISFWYKYFIQNFLKKRIKPRVLQLPITNRCNSKCITCGIWEETDKIDIDPYKLKKVLKDPFFNKIQTVGINGGEPSLYKNIKDVLDALLVLPKLKRIHIISNAMHQDKLLSMMTLVKQKCTDRKIKVYLSVSIDGIGTTHNKIRGVSDAFEKTIDTLKVLNKNKTTYCDFLDAGYTISTQNANNIIEAEAYLDSLGINAHYHLAVPNKRLGNFTYAPFYIFNDRKAYHSAIEYFWGEFKYGKTFTIRLRSFLNFYYLKTNGKGRIAGCNYLRSDITINPNLDVFLCATASDKVGNLQEKTGRQLLQEKAFYKQEIKISQYCQTCAHYNVFPTIKGSILYLKYSLSPIVWIKYKIKSYL